MTDCCLCVCLRPQPYRRLTAGLFPPGAKGNEPTLLPVDVSKLTKYALDQPQYLAQIGRDLSQYARRHLKRGKYG